VTHVLMMAAGELDDPLTLCVQIETDDRTLHPFSVRAVARVTFHAHWPRDRSEVRFSECRILVRVLQVPAFVGRNAVPVMLRRVADAPTG
jgi:hypothetical protein